MSFANQALCAEYVWKKGKTLEKKVYGVPLEIDKQVALLKLETRGDQDRQTDERAEEVSVVLGNGNLMEMTPEKGHLLCRVALCGVPTYC